MRIILDEKETKEYLSLKERAKNLYKKHNLLVEKIQNITQEDGDSNYSEINYLKKMALPFRYEDLEELKECEK